MKPLPRTVEWIGELPGHLRLIDQTLLPTQIEFRDCRTAEEAWEAIRMLRVRGAPAIGVATAYAVVLGMQTMRAGGNYNKELRELVEYLRTSRPTAVNLFWAIERMEAVAVPMLSWAEPSEITQRLLDEARSIEAEDREMCHAIGRNGAGLIQPRQGVLTHCNAGALATAGTGTALAVMYAAAEEGTTFSVYADETRPLLQGARLTAWELQQAGIDVTVICDNMAAQVMREGRVQLVIVGADRIAANGDTANKIGTYGVAVLAKAHGIPFYVAAPSSTFDLRIQNGNEIPIEQRDPREITQGFGMATVPVGVRVYNPAFDVTPAGLISAIITEKGVIQPVHASTIQALIG